AILFRKGIDHGRNRLLFPAGGQLIFRIGRWIDHKLLERQVGYSKVLRIPAVITPLSQSEVMRYPEQPAFQVEPRLALLQMLEQRKESFLDDFFRVRHRERKTQKVSKQWLAEPIEQSEHLLLYQGSLRV